MNGECRAFRSAKSIGNLNYPQVYEARNAETCSRLLKVCSQVNSQDRKELDERVPCWYLSDAVIDCVQSCEGFIDTELLFSGCS